MKRKKTPSLTLVSSLSTAASHSLLHRLISASRALPSCLLTTGFINKYGFLFFFAIVLLGTCLKFLPFLISFMYPDSQIW
ncbi:hypothetical protein Gohar_016757 [Gossypium harknessii]|uniref:Uncharacterized protein n=1 Tax=Gossypium harknessii TaxID=34285 RepID=A0A7J9G460_9ROSI|nr:hypothetical protein [Gossypium harknessii]